jgi:hypothetical protein
VSIVKNSPATYRLTPDQLLVIIANDMGVKPQDITVRFQVEMIGGDWPGQSPVPTFTGCTVEAKR